MQYTVYKFYVDIILLRRVTKYDDKKIRKASYAISVTVQVFHERDVNVPVGMHG